MDLIVTCTKNLTDRIKLFRLEALENFRLPRFTAGAYLPVQVLLSNGKVEERQYSLISGSSNIVYYEIAVTLEANGRGGSRFMHEQVHVNQILKAGLPCNKFFLSQTCSHYILIAGGIGITPMLSMLRSIDNKKISLELHYSSRTLSDFIYMDEIKNILGDKVFFYTSESQIYASLDLSNLLAIQKLETSVYTCGPTSMIQEVRRLAEIYKWNVNKIHFENFGPSSIENNNDITIHLSQSKKHFVVKQSESILDIVLLAGIKVPYDCKRGVCGMCAVQVMQGQPDHRDMCLSDDEKINHMCICVSRSKGKVLVLDL